MRRVRGSRTRADSPAAAAPIASRFGRVPNPKLNNSAAPYRVKSYNLKIDQRFNDYNNALQYLDSINP